MKMVYAVVATVEYGPSEILSVFQSYKNANIEADLVRKSCTFGKDVIIHTVGYPIMDEEDS